MIHRIPNSKKYIMFLVYESHTTCFSCEPGVTLSIVPIENTQTAAMIHIKNTAKLMKKKMIGTEMILKVDPTKSAAASKIAIEIIKVLHMQTIANK
jgi:hypothetical protein